MKTNVADTRGEMDKEIYLSACVQSTFIYLSARVQCALLYLSAGPPDCPPDSGGKCSITLVFWERHTDEAQAWRRQDTHCLFSGVCAPRKLRQAPSHL